MKFIILLMTVLLQRQTRQEGYHRDKSWFVRWLPAATEAASGNRDYVLYALFVVLPCIFLSAILASLGGLVGGLISLVLQVVLFLYILGRDDYSQRFQRYQACWKREDYQAAYECAHHFLSVEAEANTHTPEQLHQQVQSAVLQAWFERFFIFVFWFLVLGIAGPLFCLLTLWFYKHTKREWVNQVWRSLQWIPVRLLAITIALAGDFSASFSKAMGYWFDFEVSPSEVLTTVVKENRDAQCHSFSCDNAESALMETNKLMFRCAVIWLLIVALLTLLVGF